MSLASTSEISTDDLACLVYSNYVNSYYICLYISQSDLMLYDAYYIYPYSSMKIETFAI